MEVKTTLLRIVYKALCDSPDGNPVRWALMCYTAAQQVLTMFVRPSPRMQVDAEAQTHTVPNAVPNAVPHTRPRPHPRPHPHPHPDTNEHSS